MAEKHLGPGCEVHGGGLDLRFPHHENELAQSRGAGRPFARTWMHNGLIELGADKMSKSIGNIVSLREALDRWGREAILVFFLGAHYRSPLEYSDITMQAARAQADDFRRAFRRRAATRLHPQPGGIEHSIGASHAGVDGRDLIRGQRPGQVETFHFRGEHGPI